MCTWVCVSAILSNAFYVEPTRALLIFYVIISFFKKKVLFHDLLDGIADITAQGKHYDADIYKPLIFNSI